MFSRLRNSLKKSLEIKFKADGSGSSNSVVIVKDKLPSKGIPKSALVDFEKNGSVLLYPKANYERKLFVQVKKDSDIFSSAVSVVNTLNNKKLESADLQTPKKLKDSDLIKWLNTAILTNYENSQKTEPEKSDQDDPKNPKEKLGHTLETLYLDRDLSKSKEFTDSISSAYCSLYARDLANTRGSEATPQYMVERAQELYNLYPGSITMEVITGEELKSKGLNLLYNVGKGASCPPSLVILKYTPVPDSSTYTALVGKGLTFDTGGLNLKPTNSIEDMYLDKSGACTALATFRWAVETSLQSNLTCTLALAENAIGSKSYKPLDIIKSLKGKTVEIGNTDAEGRLCLADALTYTQLHYKPSTVIDLATLTGACVVALGEETAGAFGDSKLIKKLSTAGEFYQEHIWELPINNEHKKSIKGKVADLSNTGKSRYGGASTAAAFLENFIEKGVTWAHLDIAGPAMGKSQRKQFSAGGTGFGVQLLTKYLIDEFAIKSKEVSK